MKESMRQSGEKLIEAVAYGDAAGLPVETRSANYIAEKYGRIDRLVPATENPFYAGEYEPGAWSDDTQLTVAVARSLARANGFVIADQALTHIDAYDVTAEMDWKGKRVKRGWGRSTTTAMRRLKKGVNPRESGLEGGAGNGILMKMAPLSFWHAARQSDPAERHYHADVLTRMTHDSPEARVTARVHDDVLVGLIRGGFDADALIHTAKEAARRHEWALYAEPVTTDALRYLHADVTEEEILRGTDAKGFYAPQTLAMAYGALIAHRARFRESVYAAVNLGGDTDSIASIVGAMSMLADGSQELPDDADTIDRRAELRAYSRVFTEAAFGEED